MNIRVVAINCELSRANVRDAVNYANEGMSRLPIRFRLERCSRRAPNNNVNDLLLYLARTFDPPVIGIVSRDIGSTREDIAFGITEDAWSTSLVRGDPTLRRGLRNRGIAQSLIHESLHIGMYEHHRNPLLSEDGQYCPFNEFFDPVETSIYPCKRCHRKFELLYARLHAA